ncbi:hypothetical protein CAAN3_13S03730 [[Candida] anglica]
MASGTTPTVRRTRSRLGCYTCRRRKKKCDEESYPICQNCQSKGLTCEWPARKHELNRLLEQVVYVGDKAGSSRRETPPGAIMREYKTVDNAVTKRRLSSPIRRPRPFFEEFQSTPDVLPPPPSLKRSYFLEKIALQEDVTDEPPQNEQYRQGQRIVPMINHQDENNSAFSLVQTETSPPDLLPEELALFDFIDAEFLVNESSARDSDSPTNAAH